MSIVLELPKEKTVSPLYDKVTKLVLVGHQGTGKTQLCANLPNSLVIDFEDGCKDHYHAKRMNLKEVANTNNIGLGTAFLETIKAIKLANVKAGGYVYDYIVFDGITAIEKLAHLHATNLFKQSVVGKGMINKGNIINDVVTDVPESGWLWVHRAWEELYDQCIGLAKECVIFIAHAKQGSLVKQGIKLDANDMALTGKMKLSLLRDSDACAMVYRDGNKVLFSFKTNEKDLTTKSRARHLNEKEFLMSEMNEEGILTTHWENIFPQLKK